MCITLGGQYLWTAIFIAGFLASWLGYRVWRVSREIPRARGVEDWANIVLKSGPPIVVNAVWLFMAYIFLSACG